MFYPQEDYLGCSRSFLAEGIGVFSCVTRVTVLALARAFLVLRERPSVSSMRGTELFISTESKQRVRLASAVGITPGRAR